MENKLNNLWVVTFTCAESINSTTAQGPFESQEVAKTISEKEYSILEKFEVASLDIVDRVIHVFLDHAYDLFDVEDATEEQNQNMQKAEEIYRLIDKI